MIVKIWGVLTRVLVVSLLHAVLIFLKKVSVNALLGGPVSLAVTFHFLGKTGWTFL